LTKTLEENIRKKYGIVDDFNVIVDFPSIDTLQETKMGVLLNSKLESRNSDSYLQTLEESSMIAKALKDSYVDNWKLRIFIHDKESRTKITNRADFTDFIKGYLYGNII
ncbi:unnamed protein product, partial [marine sediment metagenome]